MAAGTYNLVIEQGRDLIRTFTLTDTDTGDLISGLTAAEGTVKATAEASAALLTLDAYLTVDGNAASIALDVPQATIDALTFTKPAVWDMFVTIGGVRAKLLRGSAICVPNVTS